MQIHQNTSIFQETQEITDQINKFCQKYPGILSNELEKHSLHLILNLAQTLDHHEHHELQEHLDHIASQVELLIYFFNQATHQKIGTESEIQEILEKLEKLKNNLEQFHHHRKRVLILSSTMGQGHMSASNAIKQGFEYLYGKDFQIDIIDFYETIGPLFNKAMLKAYEGSTKYWPEFYQAFFESTDNQWPIKLLNVINYPLNASRISKLFETYNPQIIISTFPIWDYLARLITKKLPIKYFISVVTDSISIHNAWVTGKPDFQIVANHETAISLKKLGTKDEKIKVLGFPVKIEFSTPINKNHFFADYNLNPNNFTIVFLPTSEKTNITIKQVEEIHENFPKTNLFVICGRNKDLYPKLAKFNKQDNIRIINWTNQMANFIKTADVIITKAGGATIMECIAAKKPMIITQIIPGQEMGNAELIKQYNLGIIQKSAKMSLTESLNYIQKNYSHFTAPLKKISKPEANLEIAKFINKLSS